MRRSDLVGLDVTDLAFGDEGLVVVVRKSKTDQVGEGRQIGIPFGQHPETCPVRAVQVWLDEASVSEGPVFRSVNKHGHVMERRLSDKTVADVVKRSLVAAGRALDSSLGTHFGPGSLPRPRWRVFLSGPSRINPGTNPLLSCGAILGWVSISRKRCIESGAVDHKGRVPDLGATVTDVMR